MGRLPEAAPTSDAVLALVIPRTKIDTLFKDHIIRSAEIIARSSA